MSRYIPLEDAEAQLVEKAISMRKVPQLMELLRLVEEKRVSIDQLLEDIKGREPSPVEPRVREVEGKVSELEQRVAELKGRFQVAIDNTGWIRDHCAYYDGTKCTMWFYSEEEERSDSLKTIEEELDGKKVYRPLVKEQPEYCTCCPNFKRKGEPSVADKLSVATNLGIWKRDSCARYDGTKCTYWHWSEKPADILKPIKHGNVWRVGVKERPQYCIGCPKFEEKKAVP